MFGLRPVEVIYLLLAVAIVLQQLVVLRGHFDPVALAAIAFFVGLIPIGRADKNKREDDDRPISQRLGSTIQETLDRKNRGGGGDND